MARARAHRPGKAAAIGLALAVCAVVVALAAGATRTAGRPGALAVSGSPYTLMQMNLCLSGLGSCYPKVAYPGVVEEAVAVIHDTHPAAVTFNEACRNDVALIARQTRYHLRFSTVIYDGGPLPCIRPRGRGVFGDAVLTKAAIESSEGHAFLAQTDIERRAWLCVTTVISVDVCTAHLSQRIPIEVAGNVGQCAELRALLARRAAARIVIFAGDLNRRSSCAPAGFWTRSDRSAEQDPGLQQVYGTGGLRSPSAEVVPAVHTDHDILLVRAHLAR